MLSIALRTYRRRLHRNRQWPSRRLYALGLSVTYGVLYLFAACCLATGVFHPDTPPQAHPHHHDHTDHHADPAAHYPTALPDICDFALQALTTTEWRLTHTPPVVLRQGEALPAVAYTFILSAPSAILSIRAPPADAPHLV